jgi:predicted deacetylase
MTTKARYLLRFDDICPTMNWRLWAEIETVLLENNVKPILAVIPDNQDPQLMIDEPVPDFWDRVRTWRSRGWTIAMHGYQHKYVNSRKGIMGISPYSEFTGLPSKEQNEKMLKGAEIFRQEGIDPEVFVAPAHSFDKTTLQLLPKHGLRIMSDGFARYPFTTREGLFWIPQQLWKFVTKRSGVWTVCFHHNTWGKKEMEEFGRLLVRYRPAMTSVEEVTNRYANRTLTCNDRFFWRCHFAWYFVIRRLCSSVLRTTNAILKKLFKSSETYI